MRLWTEYKGYWDRHARNVGAYRAVTSMEPDEYREFYQPVLDMLEVKVTSIIDLGCGPGLLVPVLRERWPDAEYAGLDISREMINAAKHNWPDETFVQMVEPNIPWTADLIICHSVLTHISPEDARVYLTKIRNSLHAVGQASISILPGSKTTGSIYKTYFEPAIFEELLARAGFTIIGSHEATVKSDTQRYYIVK